VRNFGKLQETSGNFRELQETSGRVIVRAHSRCVACEFCYWLWGSFFIVMEYHTAVAAWLGLRGVLNFFLLNGQVSRPAW
jgi:hypothetical protein